MAIGGVMEIATITRSGDYSNIKHNEEAKVVTDQSNLVVQEHKDTQQKVRQVREGDDAEWHNRKFDAKEKGSNQYEGDGGRKKKGQDPDGTVILKGQGGFDIKI